MSCVEETLRRQYYFDHESYIALVSRVSEEVIADVMENGTECQRYKLFNPRNGFVCSSMGNRAQRRERDRLDKYYGAGVFRSKDIKEMREENKK